MAIEFKKINAPYMHGVTATVNDRAVEVVRIYEGEWTIFRAIGGKTVKGSYTGTNKSKAMRDACEFLKSSEPLEIWPESKSDVGTRV